MPETVGVRFHGVGKVYTFLAGEWKLQVGDPVVVTTQQGEALGIVAEPVFEKSEDQLPQGIRTITRLATLEDQQHYEENREKEREAFAIARDKILQHGLDMRLVDVECSFDRSKLLFYFTAEGRVDFRALVRDLAQEFRMRIELRQIGVRDEARMVGGLGVCGRPLCCASWMQEFVPVSIKMAKEQNLSMNPGKISGCCGRLLCCLKYEQETYEQMRKSLPKMGAIVSTPKGKAKVEGLRILQGTCTCRLLDDPAESFEWTAEEWAASRSERRDEGTRQSDRERGERRRKRSSVSERTVTEEPESVPQSEAEGCLEASAQPLNPVALEQRLQEVSQADAQQPGCCCSHSGGCCQTVQSEVTPPTIRGVAWDEAVTKDSQELHDGNFIDNIESV